MSSDSTSAKNTSEATQTDTVPSTNANDTTNKAIESVPQSNDPKPTPESNENSKSSQPKTCESASNSEPPKILFRKRKKRGNKRKRTDISDIVTDSTHKTSSNAIDSTNPSSEASQNKLKDIRFMQRYRQKKKGLGLDHHVSYTESGLEDPDTFRHDPEKQFGESFAEEKVQEDILKGKRDQWVQKQMRDELSKQGRKLPEEKAKTAREKERSLKEQLYALPKDLQRPWTFVQESDAGERWLSGMSEVELPIDYKLRNIEETERAKQELLKPKSKQERVLDIPRNFNQDFTSHHYDRVKDMESKRRMAEKEEKMRIEREKQKRRLFGPEYVLQRRRGQTVSEAMTGSGITGAGALAPDALKAPTPPHHPSRQIN